MFHPVGSQPPSVYWRRRLMLVGAVVLALVLIALTVKALSGGSGNNAAGSSHPTPSTTPRSTGVSTSKPAPSSSHPSSTAGTSGAHAASGDSASTASARCKPADLQVSAVVGKSSYSTTEDPLLELQVINGGTAPCVQDMADKQIELQVYNGSSRVWGSHDCQVKAGTQDRTLAVGQPYRSAIMWSGLTSDTKCQETRQRVGAGSYTLYAKLSGHLGKAAQFTIG